MDLARRYRFSSRRFMKPRTNGFYGVGITVNPDALLIIKLPDSRVLRIMSRSLFLAVVLITLTLFGSVMRGSRNAPNDSYDLSLDWGDFSMLPSLFRDLADEGLLRKGHKGLIVSSGYGDLFEDLDLEFLNEKEIEWVIESDSDPVKSVPTEYFDFAIGSSFRNVKFIDRILKTGGIMIIPLSNEPSDELLHPTDYRIVYLRQFESTIVAMKKNGVARNLRKTHVVCGSAPEAKKVALKDLEDVLLEPPRKVLAKSSMTKMKFLPDLMGDSLENYPRRVFISDDRNGAEEWFVKNYPLKGQRFDFYGIDVRTVDGSEEEGYGVSSWLRNTVKEEDYVVMKAEEEVVEELVRKHTICLIDELFLECKSQWDEGGEEGKWPRQRAYWQCLELHGRLREEGVAVHQWWS
ncbi:unnamed protein product [Cuscuta epithymum]|uniref:DUF7870 domain-containing protein n=1 Tax=Cuscuta epithymum TaxID=186058 RepID=A0AAV0CVC1_9ASTE|nr:unnamed protein product [Cuscuta epithymum]CAH9125686.1 unnamed protein product [Cuscuta epithymum]